jgi:hypothetical protein
MVTKREDNQGEGDRKAARRFNQQSEEFVTSSEGKHAIEKGAGLDDKQAVRSAEKAEKLGRKRAKEKDPEETRNYKKPEK